MDPETTVCCYCIPDIIQLDPHEIKVIYPFSYSYQPLDVSLIYNGVH